MSSPGRYSMMIAESPPSDAAVGGGRRRRRLRSRPGGWDVADVVHERWHRAGGEGRVEEPQDRRLAVDDAGIDEVCERDLRGDDATAAPAPPLPPFLVPPPPLILLDDVDDDTGGGAARWKCDRSTHSCTSQNVPIPCRPRQKLQPSGPIVEPGSGKGGRNDRCGPSLASSFPPSSTRYPSPLTVDRPCLDWQVALERPPGILLGYHFSLAS
jgi:hypothetical protein